MSNELDNREVKPCLWHLIIFSEYAAGENFSEAAYMGRSGLVVSLIFLIAISLYGWIWDAFQVQPSGAIILVQVLATVAFACVAVIILGRFYDAWKNRDSY